MTDCIQEMMKTAGVEPLTAMGGVQCGNIVYDVCMTELVYPDFTPEKQIEIIKLIATNTNDTHYRHLGFDKDEIDNNWYFSLNVGTQINAFWGIHQDFHQALAQLTIEMMNAGELDKQKVKEILEK